MMRVLKPIIELQKNLITVSPVTLSAAATQTRGTDWNTKVRKYYDFEQCMILSQLYPNQPRPQWPPPWLQQDLKKCEGAFPAVAEHVIPKGQELVGKAWEVKVWEGHNGLLLLRHLERKFQAGEWSMLPITDGDDAGLFEIFVSEECRHEQVKYQNRFGKDECEILLTPTSRCLRFGDLQGKKVDLLGKYKNNPSLRALYLKAEMAHRVHGLPHPDSRIQAFTAKCPKMLQPNWRLFRASVPDPELPVVEDVQHED